VGDATEGDTMPPRVKRSLAAIFSFPLPYLPKLLEKESIKKTQKRQKYRRKRKYLFKNEPIKVSESQGKKGSSKHTDSYHSTEDTIELPSPSFGHMLAQP
jgi:hypothetical protein